jgi:hypothetical protein
MRIGLYNRHLATLGGGERHSLAVASALAEHHEVQVISHSADAWPAAAGRLKLNLDRVTLRVVPPRFAADLAPLTAEYDCFINASNLDFIPPGAPYNILLVYFPLAPATGWTAPLRRQIAATMRRWLEVTPEYRLRGGWPHTCQSGMPGCATRSRRISARWLPGISFGGPTRASRSAGSTVTGSFRVRFSTRPWRSKSLRREARRPGF